MHYPAPAMAIVAILQILPTSVAAKVAWKPVLKQTAKGRKGEVLLPRKVFSWVLAQCQERSSRTSMRWSLGHAQITRYLLLSLPILTPRTFLLCILLFPLPIGWLFGLEEFNCTRSLIPLLQLINVFECINRNSTPWKQLSPLRGKTLCPDLPSHRAGKCFIRFSECSCFTSL